MVKICQLGNKAHRQKQKTLNESPQNASRFMNIKQNNKFICN